MSRGDETGLPREPFAGQYLVRERRHADAAQRGKRVNDVLSMFLPRNVPIGTSS